MISPLGDPDPPVGDPPLRHFVGHLTLEAVLAAADSGLIDALGEPRTAAELAARLDLSERAVALVLDLLCALGCVLRRGDRFERLTFPEGLEIGMDDLPRFLRSGEPVAGIDDLADRGPVYQASALAMAERLAPAARELARRLRPATTILDVGAGSGVWSLEMIAPHSAGRLVGLDLPEVVPRFLTMAERYGLADRVEGCAGSYFDALPEGPFDRIVMANILHLEDASAAEGLVARFAPLLSEGGELVIIDFLGGQTHRRQLAQAAYALHLGIRSAKGRPYDVAELRQWCATADLHDHRLIELTASGGALGALVAR